ncbi:E3 ubiquitin-protein ligase RZFP34-like isoform X3 [Miscanthus floridulus]|uniref:E3 ubiquitin-protein ligase RZFP34-like isoform X3 n=1 Tax=Miscanthus floridulus TaxID=154761 RepID=UPI00345AE902
MRCLPCALVEPTYTCTALPPAYIARGSPCRADCGVALGSTSLLTGHGAAPEASEQPPDRARRRPCLAPSPVRSPRYARCMHRPTISESEIRKEQDNKGERCDVRAMDADAGPERYGCAHYRRKCKIRAPCCGEVFDCRHCHNEAKDSLEVSIQDRHVVPRHDIKLVLLALPARHMKINSFVDRYNKIVQIVEHVSVNTSARNATSSMMISIPSSVFSGFVSCSLTFQVSKNQFHCDGCGICRTGGAENFYHCDKCGCCYTSLLKDSHHCVDRAMHHNCPVCIEYLFDSTKAISVLHCGHTIHLECLYEMRTHQQFSCPVCLRSACNMSDIWQKLDQEVAASPMPAIYQKKMVRARSLEYGSFATTVA